MKIRNGFVSNSSSSSYIIKVTGAKEACPTCGNKTLDIIEHIQKNCSEYNETYLADADRAKVLLSAHDDVVETMREVITLSSVDPDSKPYNWSNSTAKELLIQTKKSLEYLQTRFNKLTDTKGNICRICISYHDTFTNNLLDEGLKAGTIEMIEDNN